ncbi:MAG: cell division FtsA domain-containing protein [Patescibacteria group bacterium]|jgi:cell division protein FtsA
MAFFSVNKAKKSRGEAYIAVDLGTEAVKSLVFERREQQCSILGKGRAFHPGGIMRGGMVINISEAVPSLRQAVEAACAQADIQPKNLVMSLSGDLVKSLVTTVHYHRARPDAHIDSNELKNILYKAQWKAFEQIRSLVAKEQKESDLGFKLINTTIVDTRIDGYKVSNPLNFQGSMITLSIFNAFAPLVHLGALQALADELGLNLVSVAAGPYALTKSLLVDNPEFSAVFIDMGAYLTDVAVVSEGGIFGMQNFALGSNAFSKNIATSLKVTPDKAEQIKIDYSSGLIDKRSENKLHRICKETAALWVQGVAESLDEFSHLDILPNKIFLAGGGAVLPEIKQALLMKAWAEHLPFAKKPAPAVIEPTDIPNIVLHNQVTIDLGDMVVLGLANLTLALPGKEDVLGDMLRRLVVNMQA